MRKRLLAPAFVSIGLLSSSVGVAQQHTHHRDHAATPTGDTRQFVHNPDELREHTLANMRDHLLALQEIQAALAQKREDKAARIAEERLGMSSRVARGSRGRKVHAARDAGCRVRDAQVGQPVRDRGSECRRYG